MTAPSVIEAARALSFRLWLGAALLLEGVVMAWGWSHTVEAYADAEANLRELPIGDLRVIWAEWVARIPDAADADHEGFSPDAYPHGLERASAMGADELADYIWENASELATCDNGGWNAWVCPYGCHTVSFDRNGKGK